MMQNLNHINNLNQWILALPIIIPIIMAAISVMARAHLHWQPWIGITAITATLVNAYVILNITLNSGPITIEMGNWKPPFGIILIADVLASGLILATSLITLIITIFALAEMKTGERRFGFFPMILMLLAGLNGIFLTADIFNLYVWLEVLLISSFALLILGGEKPQIDGAIKYAAINFIATTLFLIATALIYGLFGTLNIADLQIAVQNMPQTTKQNTLIYTIALLYLLALGIKAAIFPLHFWLPASYHTPHFAVSAIFAALLTKAALYVIYRLFYTIFQNNIYHPENLIYTAAIITMLFGAIGAIAQKELRKLIGYLVISGIGMILLGIALATKQAINASIFYIIHSMNISAGLYLIAGTIRNITGSETLKHAAGLWKNNYNIAILFLILTCASAGIPPFSGFWPKIMLANEAIKQHSYMATAAVLATGLLTTIAIGRAWIVIAWRDNQKHISPTEIKQNFSPKQGENQSALITVPIIILAAISIIIGLLPDTILPIIDQATQTLLNPNIYSNAILKTGNP